MAALKADPSAALDPALTTPELAKIFDEAKKAAGSGSSSGSSTAGAGAQGALGRREPHAARRVAGQHAAPDLHRAVGRRGRSPRSSSGTSPSARRSSRASSCGRWARATAARSPARTRPPPATSSTSSPSPAPTASRRAASARSKEPFKTTIKNELEGEAPHLPGKKPSAQCKEKGDCPPGMPGCDSGKRHEARRQGLGLELRRPVRVQGGPHLPERDLRGGHGRRRGQGRGQGLEEADEPHRRGRPVRLAHPERAERSVCDGGRRTYACFLQGTNNQFFGVPVAVGNTDGIQGGGAFARRPHPPRLRPPAPQEGRALSIGLRVGFAFGGPSPPTTSTATATRTRSPSECTADAAQTPAKAFLPVHAELRLSYHLLGSMMEDKKFRPYVFVDGGLAQVNGSVPVAVCDANITSDGRRLQGLRASRDANACVRQVNAYQITGLNFTGFGAGTTFGITPVFGVDVEAKFMFMFPTFGASSRRASAGRSRSERPRARLASRAGPRVASGRGAAAARPSGAPPLVPTRPVLYSYGWSTTISRRRCSSSRRAARGSPRAASRCGLKIDPASAGAMLDRMTRDGALELDIDERTGEIFYDGAAARRPARVAAERARARARSRRPAARRSTTARSRVKVGSAIMAAKAGAGGVALPPEQRRKIAIGVVARGPASRASASPTRRRGRWWSPRRWSWSSACKVLALIPFFSSFLLVPFLVVCAIASAVLGGLYTWQYNQAGRRAPLGDEPLSPKQILKRLREAGGASGAAAPSLRPSYTCAPRSWKSAYSAAGSRCSKRTPARVGRPALPRRTQAMRPAERERIPQRRAPSPRASPAPPAPTPARPRGRREASAISCRRRRGRDRARARRA